jgi:hypothetical protein
MTRIATSSIYLGGKKGPRQDQRARPRPNMKFKHRVMENDGRRSRGW